MLQLRGGGERLLSSSPERASLYVAAAVRRALSPEPREASLCMSVAARWRGAQSSRGAGLYVAAAGGERLPPGPEEAARPPLRGNSLYVAAMQGGERPPPQASGEGASLQAASQASSIPIASVTVEKADTSSGQDGEVTKVPFEMYQGQVRYINVTYEQLDDDQAMELMLVMYDAGTVNFTAHASQVVEYPTRLNYTWAANCHLADSSY
ncbi:hypothetical protein CYMTET_31414, partial [Cymbomonas tetramitiformis]